MGDIKIIKSISDINTVDISDVALFGMDVEMFLDSLPEEPIFDLVVTSPPYNIGKEYEKKTGLEQYIQWQSRIIHKIYTRLKDTGSICWQVGNYVDNGAIIPLDFEFAPIFKELNMQLRNRIIWHFGHGLHSKKRFSGRYEVVLWYTKTDNYTFNEWDMACLNNNTARYVFHLWCLEKEMKQLAVISVEEMNRHIPRDTESGKWKAVSIPFAVFADKFAVWNSN